MRKNVQFVFCILSGFAHVQAQDFDIAKKIIMNGNSRGALACVTCHQENGAGNAGAGFPQLASMNADYFSKQMRDFQQMKRMNPIMQPIAKGLDENEIKNLASYFASLSAVPNPKVEGKNETFELGKNIAERGLWGKGLPACYSCHGPSGRGVGWSFPGITIQGKPYLIQQLQAWQKGDRKNDPNQLMATIANKLTQKEVNAVAEFLSSGKTETNQ